MANTPAKIYGRDNPDYVGPQRARASRSASRDTVSDMRMDFPSQTEAFSNEEEAREIASSYADHFKSEFGDEVFEEIENNLIRDGSDVRHADSVRDRVMEKAETEAYNHLVNGEYTPEEIHEMKPDFDFIIEEELERVSGEEYGT